MSVYRVKLTEDNFMNKDKIEPLRKLRDVGKFSVLYCYF